jgi:glycosyltransferase involved in cell wall biosynthesis
LLAVGRLVPENGFQVLLAAYAAVAPRMPLVLVGDASYSDAYKRQLQAMASAGVIFTGYQFGAAYQELSAHAYAFLFGAEVGGTHPVLVEQLSHGNGVIARWTPSNQEVAGDAALYFGDQHELEQGLARWLIDEAPVRMARERARTRARAYSWDEVTRAYAELLSRLASRGSRNRVATKRD